MVRILSLVFLLTGLTAALPLAGCGGGGEQEPVDAYVEQVNAVQSRFDISFARANAAYRTFAAGRPSTPRQQRQLQAAVESMWNTRALLARIQPPPEARRLHADLLRLFRLDANVALELSLMSTYLPAAERGLVPAERAGDALRRDLRDGETATDQAKALARYRREIDEVLARFNRLAPPPVLLPWHDGQLRRMAQARTFAGALADALAKEDQALVEKALSDFARVGEDTAATVRAQAIAAKAFNRKLRVTYDLIGRIRVERARLAQEG